MTGALGLTSVNAKTVPSVAEKVEAMNSHNHEPVLPKLHLLLHMLTSI